MRPLGEVSLVLLGAMVELRTDVQAPTLRELAVHTQVGMGTAENTVKNLKRHGHVRIVRTRRVAHVNKPVAEYEPTAPIDDGGAGFVDLGSVISSAWR